MTQNEDFCILFAQPLTSRTHTRTHTHTHTTGVLRSFLQVLGSKCRQSDRDLSDSYPDCHRGEHAPYVVVSLSLSLSR